MEAFLTQVKLELKKGDLFPEQPYLEFHVFYFQAEGDPEDTHEVNISFTLPGYWSHDLVRVQLNWIELQQWFITECLADETIHARSIMMPNCVSRDFVVDLTHLHSHKSYVGLLSPHLAHYKPLIQIVMEYLDTDTRFQLWQSWWLGEKRQKALRQLRRVSEGHHTCSPHP